MTQTNVAAQPHQAAKPVRGAERFDVWAPEAGSRHAAGRRGALPDEPPARQRAGATRAGGPPRTHPTGADVDYGYLLDGDETPLPDPRTRRQPDGVHALSRTFDPGAHSWQDAGVAGQGTARVP